MDLQLSFVRIEAEHYLRGLSALSGQSDLIANEVRQSLLEYLLTNRL